MFLTYAEIYFYISAVSYPFIGLYNAGAALFRAKGDSKISMKASLVMNVVNIVGNAVLIYVFHLEVLGAAIATLIGRILAAIWVTAQLQRRDNPLRIASLADLKPNLSIAHRILAIGIPAVLSLYFDWFSSAMQAFIFCMLTMIFIKSATE